jgi:transcription elongation factor Elf1
MVREYIEKSTRYKILKRQNFKCAHCGKKLKYNIHSAFGEEVAHIDHIHPVSKQDTYEKGYIGRLDNMQALCPSCNISKGNKEQFYCFQCGKPLMKSSLVDGKEKEDIYICHEKGGCGTFFSKEQIEDKENWQWYYDNWNKFHRRKKKPEDILVNDVAFVKES